MPPARCPALPVCWPVKCVFGYFFAFCLKITCRRTNLANFFGTSDVYPSAAFALLLETHSYKHADSVLIIMWPSLGRVKRNTASVRLSVHPSVPSISSKA